MSEVNVCGCDFNKVGPAVKSGNNSSENVVCNGMERLVNLLDQSKLVFVMIYNESKGEARYVFCNTKGIIAATATLIPSDPGHIDYRAFAVKSKNGKYLGSIITTPDDLGFELFHFYDPCGREIAREGDDLDLDDEVKKINFEIIKITEKKFDLLRKYPLNSTIIKW